MKETQLVVSIDIFCVHASHIENKYIHTYLSSQRKSSLSKYKFIDFNFYLTDKIKVSM